MVICKSNFGKKIVNFWQEFSDISQICCVYLGCRASCCCNCLFQQCGSPVETKLTELCTFKLLHTVVFHALRTTNFSLENVGYLGLSQEIE